MLGMSEQTSLGSQRRRDVKVLNNNQTELGCCWVRDKGEEGHKGRAVVCATSGQLQVGTCLIKKA